MSMCVCVFLYLYSGQISSSLEKLKYWPYMHSASPLREQNVTQGQFLCGVLNYEFSSPRLVAIPFLKCNLGSVKSKRNEWFLISL